MKTRDLLEDVTAIQERGDGGCEGGGVVHLDIFEAESTSGLEME